MPALAQIPDVEFVAVPAFQQNFGIHAVLHHAGRAPFASDDGVQTQVPPKIVSQILWAAVEFPLPQDVEAVVIDDEDTAGSLAVGGAQGTRINTLGTAMNGV